MCECEYLALTPVTQSDDDWFVFHDSADVSGGQIHRTTTIGFNHFSNTVIL
jgi:hypothetical protein